MSSSEKKYLDQILNLLDDADVVPRVMARAKTSWLLWSIIVITITYVFYHNDRLNYVVGVLLVFVSGLFLGFSMYQGIANKQWPFLKPHINKESLEKRINDIKT